MTRRPLLHWLVVVGLVAAFAAVTWLQAWVGERAAEPGEGQRPAFTLPDLSGESRSVSEWDGQVVVLNFWATWCPPCVEEIPELVDVQARFAEQGLQVVGVAVDDLDSIRPFLKKVPVNYPILHGVTETLAILEAYGNPRGTLPYTVIIDRQGAIRRTFYRPVDSAELSVQVRPLL